ncbi:hypothetical protein DSL72_008272 [Monilinia vaccinii-corymbosi]|uniref:Uncharacterized protein n=1 Tax=Monilinia vaccinii-corymbosi TaxID=61207 RepID=A0A8A3PJB7_9HELO|nr:hypothetical protein DSL72_008272 [Monilinia vaccinii-corymbosi]
MFAQPWLGRKREREDVDEDEDGRGISGFGAHRNKRHIANLPHRTSPHAKPQITPTFTLNPFTRAPPAATPADSDSEGTPTTAEPTSSYYSWSSSPPRAIKLAHDGESMHSQGETSFANQMSEGPIYSDDFDMADSSMPLSPGPFQPDLSLTVANRVPTPIDSSFSAYTRSDKPLHPTISEPDLIDEAFLDQFRRGRRLPSPISEGEMSPSIIAEGIHGMQMEVESSCPSPEFEKEIPIPHKKGHTRSKHSLRNWNGSTGDLSGNLNGVGTKRSFSMGYRADCEKCRNKVPGHFSHIITY